MIVKLLYNKYNVKEEDQSFLEVHQMGLDRFGLPFTELSNESWWNPKEEMYYLCEEDTRKFRGRLGDTQLSYISVDIPHIPWEWEPFES